MIRIHTIRVLGYWLACAAERLLVLPVKLVSWQEESLKKGIIFVALTIWLMVAQKRSTNTVQDARYFPILIDSYSEDNERKWEAYWRSRLWCLRPKCPASSLA